MNKRSPKILHRHEANSVCFEGVYNMADVVKNDGSQFKAKTP